MTKENANNLKKGCLSSLGMPLRNIFPKGSIRNMKTSQVNFCVKPCSTDA